MDRSKIVAVVTGAIALILGIAYLLVVQFLDFRGEMLPAPVSNSAVMTVAQMAAHTHRAAHTQMAAHTHTPTHMLAQIVAQGAIDLG